MQRSIKQAPALHHGGTTTTTTTLASAGVVGGVVYEFNRPVTVEVELVEQKFAFSFGR